MCRDADPNRDVISASIAEQAGAIKTQFTRQVSFSPGSAANC